MLPMWKDKFGQEVQIFYDRTDTVYTRVVTQNIAV